MNDNIQAFKKLCFDDGWYSKIGSRFCEGDLNRRIEIFKSFKEIIKEQFAKVGIKQILFHWDFENWFNSFWGLFKLKNKMYHFRFEFYAKRLDIKALEILDDGKSFRSNREKSYWLNNDTLIPDSIKLFRLPKHRKFNVGDLVLFNKKYICKVIKIHMWSKIYYDLKHINKNATHTYITEYYLKSLAQGI